MSILVTGVEGFVGRNLAEQLKSKGYSVLAPKQAELDLVYSDAVSEYFASHDVDSIVHCATTLREGTSYPPNTCENNLRMFFNLLKHLPLSVKLINLGSGSEYVRQYWYRKMPESFFGRYVPGDAHSYAKYLISKYIEDVDNVNLLCLRIFGIYGRYEDYRYKFISNAIAKNLLKMPITINQNVIYDYMYVTDFVRIVEQLINNPTKKHRIMNVTPTQSIDLVTIAKLINQVSDFESEILVLNDGIGVEYSGDNSRLLEELGDFKFLEPLEAVNDLYQYYKARQDTLDAEALEQDDFLKYAQTLRTNYFRS